MVLLGGNYFKHLLNVTGCMFIKLIPLKSFKSTSFYVTTKEATSRFNTPAVWIDMDNTYAVRRSIPPGCSSECLRTSRADVNSFWQMLHTIGDSINFGGKA